MRKCSPAKTAMINHKLCDIAKENCKSKQEDLLYEEAVTIRPETGAAHPLRLGFSGRNARFYGRGVWAAAYGACGRSDKNLREVFAMKHCRNAAGAACRMRRGPVSIAASGLTGRAGRRTRPVRPSRCSPSFSRWPGWLCCFRLKPYVRFGRGQRGGAFTPRWRFMR